MNSSAFRRDLTGLMAISCGESSWPSCLSAQSVQLRLMFLPS